ncbi:MAG: GTP-sensing pleiotropic transcriptional regulator CodY [Bacillota bacterium]|uniref:Global transcriptional regulator CodY n=2 Tax=Carboxydocella TaxID=178898 RepID=A0A1T4RE85_9FIRM|nr:MULTISPECIES: GTP-sensing pleiotropic transcriptional regulator CodY [Carboxydocella]AVX21699.1 transcriptional pleiotropic repressor [Carboxydocella thermautotrophica]AVX32110.1 transcriptional pleiotropic repressor [Carboxydocella thermautotrophica]SKA14263.1 transcriptional pleiotropic repressor [Carboxydocella sporoproducens DSM 16521]GAW27654.1 transcriptional repressor CodY [Carboxydocella sp. ULO1]GAW31849.1 transcriptional repressor CodY [Carboxydocella sp. JDF658]
MGSLLQKTRAMNRLIQKTAGQPVDFWEMARVLARLTETRFWIIGRRGKLLGWSDATGSGVNPLEAYIEADGHLQDALNEQFLNYNRTEITAGGQEGWVRAIVPVFGGGDRLGTLICEKEGQEFTDDDLILAEYAATITGIEIMRLKNERLEKDTRDRVAIQTAMEVLSYSEIEALRFIFRDLAGEEGFVVASKLAEKYHLTRSVIVNALRKLESARVIDSRSLGMKGTYIKVLNPYLLDYLRLHDPMEAEEE